MDSTTYRLWHPGMTDQDRNDAAMTNTPLDRPASQPARQLRLALERAQQLCDSPPEAHDKTRWAHEAFHVGDLSVLALTLRD
jgi:hypothetical protein